MKTPINYALSKDDTLIIKGIAICAMLWHHLFYETAEYGQFVFQSAQLGKVCVSLFLFASAYGLTVQYEKVKNLPIKDTFKFQAKRFLKFYANYWVIFLIFVPLGVLVFGRSLHDAYGSLNAVKVLIIDILGLKSYGSYNPTWWFNLLIITMYLLFPLFYFLSKKIPILLLIFSVFLWFIYFPLLPIDTHEYVFCFVLGIIFALNVDKISAFLNRFNKWFLSAILLVIFCILTYLRTFSFASTHFDGLITLDLIVVLIPLLRYKYSLRRPAKFLGKYSINIYLIHTFIFSYFFHDFICSFKFPVLIFSVLLLSSLLVSIAIEYLKKLICLPKLITAISEKINNL